MAAKSQLLSLKAYAKHRGSTGQNGASTTAVSNAIKSGRLSKSVVYVDGQPKIRSAAEADAEWSANTLPVGRQVEYGNVASDEQIGFARARELHEVERWKLARVRREQAELELEARRGQFINAEEAKAYMTEVFATVKGRLRGVPTRYKQRVPATTPEAMAVLVTLIDEVLEELADGAEGS